MTSQVQRDYAKVMKGFFQVHLCWSQRIWNLFQSQLSYSVSESCQQVKWIVKAPILKPNLCPLSKVFVATQTSATSHSCQTLYDWSTKPAVSYGWILSISSVSIGTENDRPAVSCYLNFIRRRLKKWGIFQMELQKCIVLSSLNFLAQ